MIYKGSYEDLIYILIGIIWIGYSIYKGVQKNKAAKTTTTGKPSETKSKSFLEKFLDELAEQGEKSIEHAPPEKATITEQEFVTEPEFVTEKKNVTKNGEREFFSYDDNYEKSNFDESSDVYKPDAVTGTEIVKKAKYREKPKKRKTKIDMKKAVIYSEILNPRYF